MARVTARDVAQAAGVSQTTVSFVLNDRADQTISESTRLAVLDAARRLDYVPSGAARNLRRGRSNVVLCVIPDIPVTEVMEVFRRGLSRVLEASGLTCVFLHTEDGTQLTGLWSHVDPVVVLSFGALGRTDAEHIRRTGVALIDDLLGTSGKALTGLDQTQIGELQVRHLAARGHTRIGFGTVGDPREAAFCAPRLHGAQQACGSLGLLPPVVFPVEYTRVSGLAAARHWADHQVTAVAAFNDLVGLTLLAGARDAGLGVPEDLAVVGVDNLPIAALVSPQLSTVAIDPLVLATALAGHIVAAAGMPESPTEPSGSALRLIEREST
ncbi:LacI family DNA-binding transcriptional regulator [Nocardia sp. NPDC006630]|uniref:LacI family DNA-binding transcriptional regulator n=1 Tax=Nocardia sp. NPDC006630 TaxID=3157181 RepID=UPI0033BE79C9